MDDPDDPSHARAPEPSDVARIAKALNDAGASSADVVVASPATLIGTNDTCRPQDQIDRQFLATLTLRP